LDNTAIRVREWYVPIAREWLETHYQNFGEIHLMVDGTKIGFGHQGSTKTPSISHITP
jgi:hypothetical protein